MIKSRISVPSNYNITPMSGNVGIVRKDKNGPKWTWEPVYDTIQVAKCYGRIVVLYHARMSTDDFYRISSYDKKNICPFPVYDALFGEDFIWIQTEKPSTGSLEWFKLDEDFKPVKNVPNFTFVVRNREFPMHIPVGQTKIGVKNYETKYLILDLISGAMVEPEQPKKPEAPQSPKLPSKYNIRINKEKCYVELLDITTGTVLDHSNNIGEIEAYAPIIKLILGSLENVDCQQAQAILKYTRAFEPFFPGIVLGIMYQYVTEQCSKDNWKASFSRMVDELMSGWETGSDGRQYKVYIFGGIIILMARKPGEKITVGTKMLHEEDDESDAALFEILNRCHGGNNEQGVTLHISEVSTQELTEKQIQPLPMPYCITQKKALAKDIVKYAYNKGKVVCLKGQFKGTTGNAADGDLAVIICEGFKYKSKQKVGGKLADWVTTNVDAIIME